MRKTKRIHQFLSITAISLGLAACGGGGGDNGFSPSVRNQIQGDWRTGCNSFTNGTSTILTQTFSKERDGSDSFYVGIKFFSTADNCTGAADVTVLGGPVSYKGSYTTSTCTAEKIDETITAIVDNGSPLTGSDAQQFLIQNGIPQKTYDLACKRGNQLLLGDDSGSNDGSTPGTRPTTMDQGTPYFVWNRQQRQARNVALSTQERIEQIRNALAALGNSK